MYQNPEGVADRIFPFPKMSENTLNPEVVRMENLFESLESSETDEAFLMRHVDWVAKALSRYEVGQGRMAPVRGIVSTLKNALRKERVAKLDKAYDDLEAKFGKNHPEVRTRFETFATELNGKMLNPNAERSKKFAHFYAGITTARISVQNQVPDLYLDVDGFWQMYERKDSYQEGRNVEERLKKVKKPKDLDVFDRLFL